MTLAKPLILLWRIVECAMLTEDRGKQGRMDWKKKGRQKEKCDGGIISLLSLLRHQHFSFFSLFFSVYCSRLFPSILFSSLITVSLQTHYSKSDTREETQLPVNVLHSFRGYEQVSFMRSQTRPVPNNQRETKRKQWYRYINMAPVPTSSQYDCVRL